MTESLSFCGGAARLGAVLWFAWTLGAVLWSSLTCKRESMQKGREWRAKHFSNLLQTALNAEGSLPPLPKQSLVVKKLNMAKQCTNTQTHEVKVCKFKQVKDIKRYQHFARPLAYVRHCVRDFGAALLLSQPNSYPAQRRG